MLDFVNRLKYSDPQLWELVKHWPVTIFLPCVLLLIACLALVTRMWDERRRGSVGGKGAAIDED